MAGDEKHERSQTISLAEIAWMRTLPKDGKAARLAGSALVRARRLAGLGLLSQGRLSEKHYGLSELGRNFLDGVP